LAISTREIDHGFKGIVRELKKLEEKPFVKVGYPAENADEKHDGDGFVTVLSVAIWHEFGTIHLPERSFIRAAFDKHQQKYEDLNKDLIKKIYGGRMTVEKALAILGLTIENDIKEFVTSGEVKPESERAKNDTGPTSSGGFGIGKTLYDTGQLVNSLTHIVVMNP
jgi:hypothetical protein